MHSGIAFIPALVSVCIMGPWNYYSKPSLMLLHRLHVVSDYPRESSSVSCVSREILSRTVKV